MGTTVRMALLITSGIMTLMCQACSTHSAVPNSVSYFSVTGEQSTSAEPAVAALSDGQRMATAATFGVQTGMMDNGAAVHAHTSSLLDTQAYVTVDAMKLTEGELEVVEAFAISAPRSQASMALSDRTWSAADGVRAFEGDRNIESYMQPLVRTDGFSAEFALAAPAESTGLGFDLSLSPRVSYSDLGRFATRSVGAEVRLGQNFDQRGESIEVDSWYVFAGQDGEALVWEAGDHGFSNITGAMALRDKVTVGDVQAGIAVQRGAGELSLSYIHREVEWRDRNGGASTNEDFAGVSFTMKR